MKIVIFWNRKRKLQRNKQRKLQLHWATSNVDEKCERLNQFTNFDVDFDVDVDWIDERLLLTKTVIDARRQNEQIDFFDAVIIVKIKNRLIWYSYSI